MRNRILLVIGLLVIIGLLAFGYLRLTGEEPTVTIDGEVNLLPAAELTPAETFAIPEGETIEIQGTGGIVTVKNFYPNSRQVLASNVIVTSTLEYEISYERKSSKFTLLLLPDSNATYRTYREQAEALLLETLGITKGDACKLTVSVEVPEDYPDTFDLTVVSPTRLSFCQSSPAINPSI